LLNDNDIRGAKWILININSSEGDHEFTMDEVEIIQHHLISQAGEDTDVILGLGYDAALGDKIGITIIATGFEYKDPFKREEKPEAPKKEEKIVMPLQMPVQGMMKPKEVPVVEMITNEKPLVASGLSAEMTPRLVETPESLRQQTKTGPMVVMPPASEKKLIEEFPVDKKNAEEPIEWIFSQDIVSKSVSGGYLTRPSNIYDEESDISDSTAGKTPEQNEMILATSIKTPVHDENPGADMSLIFKEAIPAADESRAHQTTLESMADQPAEDPAMQDEAEGLKRRAAERINKLRNLSFNMNAADPNNEFETVPAYIRRNLELYNTVTNVESFYSQYEVKADKNNLGEISTINSFLDGKKPD
jgi:cell division protein FtsZ